MSSAASSSAAALSAAEVPAPKSKIGWDKPVAIDTAGGNCDASCPAANGLLTIVDSAAKVLDSDTVGWESFATASGCVFHAPSTAAAEEPPLDEGIAVAVAVSDATGSKCEVNIALNKGV